MTEKWELVAKIFGFIASLITIGLFIPRTRKYFISILKKIPFVLMTRKTWDETKIYIDSRIFHANVRAQATKLLEFRDYRIEKEGKDIQKEINFDYINDDPLKHGWEHGVDIGNESNYDFRVIPDEQYSGILFITLATGNYFDYYLEAVDSIFKKCRIIFKPKNKAVIYLHIVVRKSAMSPHKDGWLLLGIGDKKPERFKGGHEGWYIFLIPEKLPNGWFAYDIDIDQEVKKSYGIDGFEFTHLLGFRLRKTMDLAKIQIMEPEFNKELVEFINCFKNKDEETFSTDIRQVIRELILGFIRTRNYDNNKFRLCDILEWNDDKKPLPLILEELELMKDEGVLKWDGELSRRNVIEFDPFK